MLLSNLEVPGTRIAGGSGTRLMNASEEPRNGVHTSRGFCYSRLFSGIPVVPAKSFSSMDFAPGLLALFSVLAPEALQGAPFLR